MRQAIRGPLRAGSHGWGLYERAADAAGAEGDEGMWSEGFTAMPYLGVGAQGR